MNINFIAKSSS